MAKLYQNRFEVAPSKSNIQRSQFKIPYNHKTTGNFGDLIPFYWQECLPGDVWQVSTRMLSRMSTPLFPVMDNAFIDYYYFFVPNRLVWSHWAEFLGENKLSAWVNDIEYIMPHAEVEAMPGGLADHLGVPLNFGQSFSLDICFLLPRCYWLCWNEWFRDENTTDPILINTGDSVTPEEVTRMNGLCKVAKYHDQFTSALPSPQKGDAVDIPLAEWLPVVTRTDLSSESFGSTPMVFDLYGPTFQDDRTVNLQVRADSVDQGPMVGYVGDVYKPDSVDTVNVSGPRNLWANTDGSAVSINALRQAFQMQRLLELQARSGSRYTEIIRASFSVISPDARLQRPEYLGGTRVNIQMQQVAQTSSTNDESPLGHLAAYSKTVSGNRDFSYSCTEHGFIIGLMCARTAHTYQQGLHKMWSRRDRYDLYWPTFAHLGEQPILRKELYATGTPYDDVVFGYQEAWYEYRFKANEVTGAFRTAIDGSLDTWHYADYYESAPMLSQGFIEETSVNVDRTLAVQSSLHDQLLFDIQVDAVASRPLPLYSIPGMIDHF